MADCQLCGAPDAENTPNGRVLRGGHWINVTASLCARCQRDDEREREEALAG